MSPAPSTSSPIGVFDSGVGGLSILRALQQQMPHEQFVYLADSAHAPYGERDSAFVLGRARHVLQVLRSQHGVKALVVACNTATALAIQTLRQEVADMPILGVEPAIKPAASGSTTKRVGVVATAATLQSDKFQNLLQSLSSEAVFVLQACDGLADAIERQWEQPNNTEVLQLCAKYLQAMGSFGTQTTDMDTLVLGCTHYPFAIHEWRSLLGPTVNILEPGEPVARQTQKVLAEKGLLSMSGDGGVTLLATGEVQGLQHAAQRWLSV